MANQRNYFYDIPNDPFATTTDSISEYYRVQSISQSGAYNDIVAPSAANYPVNTPTRYFIELPHRIDVSDLAGSRPITLYDNTSSTTLTKVTTAPAANQYRVAPSDSIRRSVIEIHSGQAGNTLSYDYYGMGSVVDALEMNEIRYHNTVTKTSTYVILDNDGFDTIFFNIAEAITTTLPTAADNDGRLITIMKTSSTGVLTIDGEGGETIDGDTEIYLFSQYDYAELICDGSNWHIRKMEANVWTGWVNRSDWTNTHIGLVTVTYDNSTGGGKSWDVGETVTETGGNACTGIIVSDSGTILLLRDITNGGVFANNGVITGSNSSNVALINEVSGDNKNQDTNLEHNMVQNLRALDWDFFISTDGTENNSFNTGTTDDTAQDRNYQMFQVDTSNIKLQSGANGVTQMTDAGTTNSIDTEDYYYNINVRRSK
jgi:hypothetical protein